MRSISLLTILALLYCPLSCVVGLGYGVSSQLTNGQEAITPICCCCPASTTKSGADESGSSDTHQKDCQGICNGAVHERHNVSIDLPELAFLAIYPAFPHVTFDLSTTLRKYDASLHDQHVRSGRELRMLFLTLTC
ncbi:hypothetical protein [Bremerella alba]|uniref:Uncharacterized protein n=1 Tax=Bremerella alba TaxID=980252 RepID=A0A7V9A6P9_9BACT|nr:hypothetical protein [Bremerella alba]MBA2114186.1 hypothetical protein [Bremerella alba]